MGKLSTHSLVWAFVAVMLAFIYLPVVVLVLFSFQSGDLPVPPLDGPSLRWYLRAFANDRLTNLLVEFSAGRRPLRGRRNAAWFSERLRHVPP